MLRVEAQNCQKIKQLLRISFSLRLSNKQTDKIQPCKHSSWWRRLQDDFRLRLQDVLIKTNIFAILTRLQKTSSRRLDQDQYIRLGHTSSRRLQDVFKTSSRHIQDAFETFWWRLQDVFKTSSRRLAKISSGRFQDVSSSYTVLVNKFSRCLQNVFTTFLRRTAKIDLPIYLDRSI